MAKQTLITHTARCDTCGAECFAANAKDWAHDHVNRNKGHAVGLELGYYIQRKGEGEENENHNKTKN